MHNKRLNCGPGYARPFSNGVVVRHAPENYPLQKGLTCGEYNVKGILDSFHIPFQAPARLRLRIRIFGYSFIEDISAILQSHGVSAPVQYASNLSDMEKIRIIKDHINKDQPVLLAIGNGHLHQGVYSPIARSLIGHFITVYGYSDTEELFYVYDPYLEGPYQEDIPVGNEIRSFRELLRDWRGPFYYNLIRMNHVYIPVGANQ